MAITLMIATIQVEPGWAVGTVTRSNPTIDRDLLLDANGQPWIPGSAIAGSLRAHLAAPKQPVQPAARSAARPPVEPPDIRLMGSRPPASQAESARSIVSPLWILGAVFTPDQPPTGSATAIETVGQTAIDRTRGAAAPGSLRFSRLAANGGSLTVYLRHDPPAAPPAQPADGALRGPAAGPAASLSDADLRLIATWKPAIGRDRTRGSGRARLVELKYGTVDPATPEGATTWLTHDGTALFDAVATHTLAGPKQDRPWLDARFEIVDGLLVGSGRPEPVASSRKRNGRPLIPGSAWKGIVRSRTEFIIRSRYGKKAACNQQTACGTCVVCAVFGHQGQRGKLAFRDSYVERLAPGTPATKEPSRTHVAIDRVTGGSRPSLLFTTAPVPAGRLHLRIDALGPIDPWVRNVIQHVLRDINDGLIGVGSRSTRGLGTLRLLDPPGDPERVVVPALETPPDQEPVT